MQNIYELEPTSEKESHLDKAVNIMEQKQVASFTTFKNRSSEQVRYHVSNAAYGQGITVHFGLLEQSSVYSRPYKDI